MGQLTIQEYLTASSYPLPDKYRSNAEELVRRLNAMRQLFNKPLIFSSGYRDPQRNLMVGGRENSKHLTAQAADIYDPSNALGQWIMSNLPTLSKLGLWCEDPKSTHGWVHFQSIPPRSGRRIFLP